MSSPRWRLAIVAGTLIILSTVGVGLAEAAPASATAPSAGAAPTAAIGGVTATDQQPPSIGERLRALGDRLGDRVFGRFGKNLVHGTVTFVDRDGALVTVQFDHGTIAAIESDAITIAETGNSSVTVAAGEETKVRKERKRASLADLAFGDEVFVVSIVDDGAATARRIVVPVPATD